MTKKITELSMCELVSDDGAARDFFVVIDFLEGNFTSLIEVLEDKEKPIGPLLRAFLAQAFKDNNNFGVSLKFEKSVNLPKGEKTIVAKMAKNHKAIRIYVSFVDRRREGTRYEDALYETAKEKGVSQKTARRYFKVAKKNLREMRDQYKDHSHREAFTSFWMLGN